VSIRAEDLEKLAVDPEAEGVEADEDGVAVASFVTTLTELRAMLEFCRSPSVDIGHLSFYFGSEGGQAILVSSEREAGPLPWGCRRPQALRPDARTPDSAALVSPAGNDDLGIVVDQVMATIAKDEAAPEPGSARVAAAPGSEAATPARGPKAKRARAADE